MNKKTLIITILVACGVVIYFLIPNFIPDKKMADLQSPLEKTAQAAPQAKVTVTSAEAKGLYTQAQEFKRKHKMLEAKQSYQQLLVKYSDIDNISTVQKELESLNLDIIFSNIPVPDKTVMHDVAVGDTLGKIASRYETTVELVKRSNGLKNDIIRVGQRLRIWTGKFNVLVDKSQNVLILKDGNEVVKVYNVSTGVDSSTPAGTFKVTTKLVDPVWFNRGVVVPPESPDNVLGSRWLGFDLPGYGIHGTIEPETIGQQVTAGCVRMSNEEVEELYSLLVKGTEVEVVD